MASYEELFKLSNEGSLQKKVQFALIDVVLSIAAEDESVPNHARRFAWAGNVLRDVDGYVDGVLKAVLTQYKSQDYSALIEAGDEAVKTAVDGVVDLLAGV